LEVPLGVVQADAALQAPDTAAARIARARAACRNGYKRMCHPERVPRTYCNRPWNVSSDGHVDCRRLPNDHAANKHRAAGHGIRLNVQAAADCDERARRRTTSVPAAMIYCGRRGSGGTGRRAGLRILWPKGRGGSTPSFRTKKSASWLDAEVHGRKDFG